MIVSRSNVFAAETASQQSFAVRVKSDDYRREVSKIVLLIQAENDWNDEQLAEEVGCSPGTIKNARLKKGNLDPVTMLNLGAMCGGQERLKPIFALINCSTSAAPSVLDRVDRAEGELRALRKAIEERPL